MDIKLKKSTKKKKSPVGSLLACWGLTALSYLLAALIVVLMSAGNVDIMLLYLWALLAGLVITAGMNLKIGIDFIKEKMEQYRLQEKKETFLDKISIELVIGFFLFIGIGFVFCGVQMFEFWYQEYAHTVSFMLQVGISPTMYWDDTDVVCILSGVEIVLFFAALTLACVFGCILMIGKRVIQKNLSKYSIYFNFKKKYGEKIKNTLIHQLTYRKKLKLPFAKRTYRKWRRMLLFQAVILGICCLGSMFEYSQGGHWEGYILWWMILAGVIFLLVPIVCYRLKKDSTILDMQTLMQAIHEIKEGNLKSEMPISEKSPLYEAGQELMQIGDGLQKSMEEQMKSEQMKVELVTNVSHDLKTPLTSIISYVDLLAMEDLSPVAQDYVNVLKQKSDRLNHMVSDLFDLAKASSRDVKLEMEVLNMRRLIEQTLADMEERIIAADLCIKKNFTEEATDFMGDSQKLYRVFQNLFDNALKYSLDGSRIYIDVAAGDGVIYATVKSTSAYEMEFTPEEILERFQRGDKNRTTEGNGLGLSIAKSFVEACGGQFSLVIDGDLFKVTISFPQVQELVEQ